MNNQIRIGDAPNTYNPALIVLVDLGFKISILPDEENEDKLGLWCAQKDNVELIADDPLSLLGLAALWKKRGDKWRRKEDKNYYQDIIAKTYPD